MGNKGLTPGYKCRCTPGEGNSSPLGVGKEGSLNPSLLENLLEEVSGSLPSGVHAACMRMAISQPNQALLERILKRGVNPNVKWFEKAQMGKPSGGTGLHLATLLDKQEMVSVLLDHSADVNIKNSYGETAIHVAASVSNINILMTLLENKNLKCVNDTSKRRRREHDERLFVGCTALEMAAGYRRASAVSILLRYGAKIGRAVDTCCALANKDDNADFMCLLLSQGLGINNHRGVRKSTLLHEAAEKGNPMIVCALLEAGAKVNSRDRSRTTPLIYAICQKQLLVIERLLRGGADVNLADTKLYTPLHRAALYGQVQVIEMLLIHGAKLNVRDRQFQVMPHHLCVTSAHSNQLALHVMLLHDAPLEASSSMGTALKLAWEENHGCLHPFFALLISHGACDDYILTQLGHVYVNGNNYSFLPIILRLIFYSGNEDGDLKQQIDSLQSWFFAVDHKYYDWLVDFRKTVQSLKIQSRVIIRRQLRKNSGGFSVWKQIKQTSLPWILQDYLKLSDLYNLKVIAKQPQERCAKEDISTFVSPFT